MSERSIEFGGQLSAARGNLGWSLQDVAHCTRIPLATLRQLEENDFSKFPSRAYAKSFLAQYSEHLGIDASEWLDHFDTGDALANLDAYEYLKDHDEHVDAAPLIIKRENPKAEKARAEKSVRPSRTASLQPLFVFSVTALLIAGAVFGFMKLSDRLSEDAPEPATTEVAKLPLLPVAGILENRRAPRPRSDAPRDVPGDIPVSSDNLVAGNPGPALGTGTLSATPSIQEDLSTDFNFGSTPPPRAVIVEE